MKDKTHLRPSSTPNRRARRPVASFILCCALVLGLLLTGPLASRTRASQPVAPLSTAPQSAVPRPAASGGGEFVAPQDDSLSDAERARIETMIQDNIDRLTAEGRLAAPGATDRVALGWPLRGRQGFTDPGYHAITAFVDHQSAFPNQVSDYSCGGRSYDSYSGYNHQGTDFFLWPFAWNKMAAGDVEIVASAAGVIVGRDDGNPDQSCSFNGNRWNVVYIRHMDGSIAWYGHMKTGSVTAKGVGATVAAGEYLGVVGSSGNSTGPHLHFELYDGGQLTDPYAGNCNPLLGGSWWASQPNYYDSSINKLSTGNAPVSWGSCPAPDVTHETNQFQPGDRITFTAYFRDQIDSLPAAYRIVAPDGSIYAQWNHSITKPHYTLAYWWWAYDFAVNVMTGTWRFEAEYNGRSYHHTFYVGQPSAPATTPVATPIPDPTSQPQQPAAWFGYVPVIINQP